MSSKFEKFRKYALEKKQMSKIKGRGGRWVLIDGELIWEEDK